ncbi:MAG: NAD(+) kinase [Pseudomonadota bacterium]
MNAARFPAIGVLGNALDSRVATPMRALVRLLGERSIHVVLDAENPLGPDLEHKPLESLAGNVDLLVAIGGDGTLLSAAAHAVRANKPLLGINRGRLGFLTDVSPNELDSKLAAMLDGDFSESRRALLNARIMTANGRELAATALNDVVLTRQQPGRMIDFATYVDGHFVNAHAGDGLIAATPTGSTAYALSCGGPIMQPELDAIALVPICPHTLSDRPIVLPGSAEIRVVAQARSGSPGEVNCDGQILGTLDSGDELIIAVSERKLTLIHPPKYDYFELLRSKLNWGRSERLPTDSSR